MCDLHPVVNKQVKRSCDAGVARWVALSSRGHLGNVSPTDFPNQYLFWFWVIEGFPTPLGMFAHEILINRDLTVTGWLVFT